MMLQHSKTKSTPVSRGETTAPPTTAGLTLAALLGLLVCPTLDAQLTNLTTALDAPALSWSTGGTTNHSAWTTVGGTNAHDGVDAAVSGEVNHSEHSWLETTLTGPGLLSFWWKVSSEEHFDLYRVMVNGEMADEISGEQDWAGNTLDLPEGPVTVRWRYSKDESYSAGSDRAWLDEVAFISTPVQPPSILAQPTDQQAIIGLDVLLSVEMTGTEKLHYQWWHNGTILTDGEHVAGAQSRVLQLTEVQTNQSGTYSVTVSNSAGTVFSSAASVTVTPPISLAEALDEPGSAWASGGALPWVGQYAITHDGSDAARSGAITNDEQSWVEVEVTGPLQVRFWWKVSSEESYDELEFLVDDVSQMAISGEVDWTEASYAIPEGLHQLRWRYSKDYDLSEGQDLAWVDQVEFFTGGAPNFSVHPLGQTILGGSTVLLQAAALGDNPIHYQWTKDGANVPGATNATLSLSNVIRATSGVYALTATNSAGSAISSNALVTVRVPQKIKTLWRQADGSVLLSSMDGDGNFLQPGDEASFTAWASTNLVEWSPLPGGLSVSNGMLWTHDPEAAILSRRFYQIREP